MILIVGSRSDVHVDEVSLALTAANVRHAVLDTSAFDAHSISFSMAEAGLTCSLVIDNLSFLAQDVETVWFRRAPQPTPDSTFDSDTARFYTAEVKHLLQTLWNFATKARWINSYHSSHITQSKPYQLDQAARLGLLTPATLISSDTAEILDFLDAHDGRLLYKPFTAWSRRAESATETIYANVLSRETILENVNGLQHFPCLFQEYVAKRVEIRAIVIGDQVFTIEIDSQASEYASVDWRRYDFDNVKHKSHLLPQPIKNQLIQFMRAIDLVFGCIDLIQTPAGDYVFLEVNSAGNWMWLEYLTGLQITKSLTALLMNPAPHMASPAPACTTTTFIVGSEKQP